MIRCYVINLKRRSDRLKNITQHLKLRGLSFIRFNAVDALNASKDILMNNMDISGPLGEVSSGDRACFQSHFNLWKLIAVKEKGVKKWKPWQFKYSVGSPSAAIENADLLVLYGGGWENKMFVLKGVCITSERSAPQNIQENEIVLISPDGNLLGPLDETWEPEISPSGMWAAIACGNDGTGTTLVVSDVDDLSETGDRNLIDDWSRESSAKKSDLIEIFLVTNSNPLLGDS